MERKYEILNNELSSMLGIETRREQGWDAEWEKENREAVKAAEEIAAQPQEKIDAKLLMERTARHAGTDNYYINLYVNGSDDEQLAEIRNIEYTAAYTLLDEGIYVAGHKFIDRKDYCGWCNVLYALRYVPLQKSFCYELKTHEDYLGVLETIDLKQVAYPKTFIRMLLGHWFEWMWKVGGQIWSYEDPRNNYERNELAQKLKEEARAIREEWERSVAVMIGDMLQLFSKHIGLDAMLGWATGENLFCTDRDNEYSHAHDGYLRMVWCELVKMGALNQGAATEMNLNLLLLLSEECVKNGDTAKAKEIDGQIKERLLKENYTGMHGLTKVDVERQKTLSDFLLMLYPSMDDVSVYMAGVATHYHGWNMDYQRMYEEVRRETYLYCCILRRFENMEEDEVEILKRWKESLALYLQAYRRCDNEYICRDEMMIPFTLALSIATRHLSEACQKWLHEMLIDNVLSIVALLTAFTNCQASITGKEVEWLYCRAEREWPSARMLMELRGQTGLRDRIDSLLADFGNEVKKS